MQLFRLMGFPIKVDASWLIIVALLTWSLGGGVFPQLVPGMSGVAYFTMGAVGAIGLFVCILLHELSHAVVARQQGLGIRGITLFIFGGVAEMTDEPRSARAEFLVAVAGPIMSLFLGLALYAAAMYTPPGPVRALAWWLGIVNFVLVVFNMLPAFPLDGGRIFRSILWYAKNDLRWATRVSSRVGLWIGIGLIALGVLRLLLGDFVGGLWFALIGMFLRGAAKMSYQQILLRKALEGQPVRRYMRTDVVTVRPELSIEAFVNEIVYRHPHHLFPVVADDGRLIGCITTRDIQQIDRKQWGVQRVGDVMRECSSDFTIEADVDAMTALATMNRTGRSRLIVLDGQQLVGIITAKDLMRLVSMKVQLEEPAPRRLADRGRTEGEVPGFESSRPAQHRERVFPPQRK